MTKKIVIAGAGGHCKVVLDIIESLGEYEIVGVTDSSQTGTVLGYPILGDDSILSTLKSQGVNYGFVALGDNSIRKKVYKKMESMGYQMISLISPRAIVSSHSSVGNGCVVMAGAIVNANSQIGNGCILNTNCSIDHDCLIDDFVHVAPGCAVSGSVRIGENSFIGTGSRIIDGIRVGNDVTIGAGAAVVKNIDSNCTAVGVPAKVIKRR